MTLDSQTDSLAMGAGVSFQAIAVTSADDSEAADDFTVPTGEVWSVDTVRVEAYATGLQADLPAGINAAFHVDEGGKPGVVVCSYPNVAPATKNPPENGSGPQHLVLQLPSFCTLCSGKTYWLSLQALGSEEVSYSWRQRTVVDGAPAVWRNPGNGLGTGCTDWSAPAACGQGDGLSPGLAFDLVGRKQTPLLVQGDFNGDLCADLVFQSPSTRQVMIWFMNGTVRVGPPKVVSNLPEEGWAVAGTHDFNGDGKNDLVLQDPQEHVRLWLMDGARFLGEVPGTNTPSSSERRIVATVDSTRNGDPDLVCQGTTGKVAIWDMVWHEPDQTWIREGGLLIDPEPPSGRHIEAAHDFDGDQTLDLLFNDASSSAVSLWLLDEFLANPIERFATPSTPLDPGWKVVASGDFGAGPNGSVSPVCGAMDIVWQNSTSLKTVVWHLNGNQERTGGLFTTPDGPGPGWVVVGPR